MLRPFFIFANSVQTEYARKVKKRKGKETRIACLFFLFGSSSIIRFLSIVSYERPFTIQICEHLNIFRNNNKVPSLPMQNGKVDGNRPRTHTRSTHTCTNLKVSKTLLGLCIDVCVRVCVIVLVCVGACRLSLLQIWLLTSISFMSCPVSFPLLFLHTSFPHGRTAFALDRLLGLRHMEMP